MQRRTVVLVLTVLTVPLLAGCFEPFRPHVSEATLSSSPHDWQETRHPRDDGGLFGVSIAETEYRFEGDGDAYPGILVVIGVRALQRVDTQDLLDRTRDIVRDTLEEEGVHIDPSRNVTGERTIHNGARTDWFRLIGTSPGSGGLFAQEEEVRVLGEAWYDGRSKTSVIAIALAQTTGQGGILGQSTVRDHTVWNELVGDESGTVGGAIHERGFIDHVVSHA